MKIPKGFIATNKKLPRFGKNIIIFCKDRKSYRAMRTETSFNKYGYVYEDIYYHDHNPQDVIAWKDGR